MSYEIHVYRSETKTLHKAAVAAGKDDFFDHEETNCVKFTKEQLKKLDKRLKLFGFKQEKDALPVREYCDTSEKTLAYLTDTSLSFSAFNNFEDVLDLLITVCEFCDDTSEFAKYNPQLDEWDWDKATDI